MTEVTIAIPTFRRPLGLARLLRALAAQQTRARIRVLVADNDAAGREGLAVCNRVAAADYRWPLETIVVAERGIAAVRNALVARALAHPAMEFLVMLDDDEWPAKGWLDALIAQRDACHADVVAGTVLRAFDKTPPRWAAGFDCVAPIRKPSGRVSAINGTGNVLFTREILSRIPAPHFDTRFTLSGGEDHDFFARLAQEGAHFAWSDEATAYEHVPASRLSLRWMLMRAYSIGNSDMRVWLKHRRGLRAVLREIAKIALAFLAAPFLLALLALPRRRFDGLRLAFRAAGKLAALAGLHYREYATTHGH